MLDLDDRYNGLAMLAAIRLQSEFRIVDPLGRMVSNDDLAKVIAMELEPLRACQWYAASEVSRDIWDGDIWFWNDGETIYPVNIMWSPTAQHFFAPSGQWGWNRAQTLTEMGGRWTPCRAPEAEPGSQSFD